MTETTYAPTLTPFQTDCIRWWATTPNIPAPQVAESVARVLTY